MFRCLTIGLAASLLSSICAAQVAPAQYVWEEFGKRIKASEKVAPLGNNFAGDQVSLSNGALSFRSTDVSIPGSNKLPVEFSRSYSIFNRKEYGNVGALADWVVDAPSLSGVFASEWVVGATNSTNRCSQPGFPAVASPFRWEDFWHGVQISIPGVTEGELLQRNINAPKPENGLTYVWNTNDQVQLSCLATIKNGVGEGFLAITPDGTKYWFDWMGQSDEPRGAQQYTTPTGTRVWNFLNRRKNFLYATRVEDRFGNVVTYNYTNAWNEPGRLTSIVGNDGRTISISYSGSLVSFVSDGTRTWSYSYGSTSSGRQTLAGVTQPDGAAWVIDLAAFTNAEIKYYEAIPGGEKIRDCMTNAIPLNYEESFVGRITHPAGAVSEFTIGIAEHGRSYVPINCRNFRTTITSGPYRGSDNDGNDDINLYSTSAYSFTLKQKRVSGPGIDQADWFYSYEPNFSFHMYPGTTYMWPICDTANYNCELPPCTNDACAKSSVTTVQGPGGDWQKYYYGNTYRYNEGKLLKVEAGASGGSPLKSTKHEYDLSQLDGAYVAWFGASLRLSGDGFANTYHRPLKKTVTEQQGIAFTYEVNEFDVFARPVKVTRSSTVSSSGGGGSGGSGGNPPVAPPTPVLTAPSQVGAGTGHQVSWTSVAGASRYVLERAPSGSSFSTIYDGTALYLLTVYPTPTTLAYRVKACDGAGNCSPYAIKYTTVMSSGGGGGGGIEP